MNEFDMELQKYLNAVCEQIRWKNYHLAVRTELKNHITDSLEELGTQGISEREALKQTLDEMGNPKILGAQLNEAYRPQYNRRFSLSIFVVSITVMVMNCFAYKTFLPDSMDARGSVICIIMGAAGWFWICHCNLSNLFYCKKYIIGMIAILFTLCVWISKFFGFGSYHLLNGILSFMSLLYCLFVGKIKGTKVIGVILSLGTIGLLTVYCMSFSYTAAFLVGINGWVIILYYIQQNWFGNFGKMKKTFCRIISSIPFIIGFFYIFNRKIDNILLNRTGFFAKEYLKNAVVIGAGKNIEQCSSQLEDYPLLSLVLCYGYIILIFYIVVLSYIFCEIICVYKKQQTVVGKAIVLSLLTSLSVTVLFSVLLNLGIPIIKGFGVPFMDFHFEITAWFIALGFLQVMDCFGNYLFIESSVSQNHLFEIEDGKIIFYYK